MRLQRILVTIAVSVGVVVPLVQAQLKPVPNPQTGRPMSKENVSELAEECVGGCTPEEVAEAYVEDAGELADALEPWTF